MNSNQITRRRHALPFSCLLGVIALAAAACGGGSTGGTGNNGSGASNGGTGNNGTGGSNGSTSGGSENTCCLNGTNYSCATADEAQSCFTNLDPGSCTETGMSADGKCGGGNTSSSSSGGNSSSGGSGKCGTGNLATDIGAECQSPSDCSTNFCDQNTPNALNSYCSQACSSIADCPCASSAGTWTCDINPKYSAVQKYCINSDAGG